MESRINARETVLEMLLDVNRNNAFSHILLKKVLDKYNYIDEYEKAFIKRLFEGTLEREITLDHVINKYSSVPVNKMKPFIRCLMRMSVYQLLYMDRVPDSAVINEAVKLAKKRKFSNLSGFINAVLRKISTQKADCMDDVSIAVKYAANDLLIESLTDDYGEERALQILEQSLKTRHVSVRIREELFKSEIDTIFDDWDKNGIEYRPVGEPEYAYELINTEDISRLECFKNGLYTVMDASAMLVCENANITPGCKVIDICAAPGGKCLHAVSKGGIVDARDVSQHKVELIEENIKRLKAESVTVKIWDATITDETVIESADILIADVPCSGFGVISKKPDIKKNVTRDSLDSIIMLQKSILDASWRYVKTGGYLIYSTCTLRKAENEEQVKYIEEHYPFETEKMQTVFPDDQHDGFFIARLKRIG